MANILADSNIKFMRVVALTFDHPSVAAETTESNDVTIPGLLPGDLVLPYPPAHTADFMVGMPLKCATADTLSIISVNPEDGSAVDPASGTWTFVIMHP